MKNPSSVLTQDKTEKDRILNLRKKYTSDERVMYEELYTLAEGMKSSHNQPNGFKKYFEYQEDTESAQSDVDTPPTGTATRSKK